MKKIVLISVLMCSIVWSAEPPFHRGVNLTGWFQQSTVQQVQFSRFTQQDFINIKSLGCDVIRLPVNLHYMTSGPPDYTVDPLFYYFFDQVVDMSEELELYLILDNHTFDPATNTDPNIGDVLNPVWTQIAGHYKNRSTYLYYEVLNEPHGISDAAWNTIQQNVIQTIRAVDSVHTIIIGPAGWNSYNNLQYMPVYSDTNLIYTFHYYDPFMFTHQGASWTDPSMVPLAGVPFPYDTARMPACPAELIGTWVESSLNNYNNDGTVARVKQLIDIAAAFKTARGVPLYCGEFGVYIPNSNNDDRVYWYNTVRSYLEEKDLVWTIWDYTGGFGLFKAGSREMFDYDLNIPLVEALGLNAPPQSEFVLKPDTTGFDLYLDYTGAKIFESSWNAAGILDYYSTDNPARGNFCLYWTDVDQYNYIGFNFTPIKDLSVLVDKGYAIDFWVRGDTPGARFDIRFIDTKTDDPNDHPWRMRMTIDETMATWDDAWHHLQIPLSDFTEQGSWDNNQWYNPQGDFDWANVDLFQIVAEHQALKGIKFWFDNIRVLNPQAESVSDEKGVPLTFKLLQNYPNPFNPTTTITCQVAKDNQVELTIYNLLGQKVRTLINEKKTTGTYSIIWDGTDDAGFKLSSGVYFCRMKVMNFVQVRKLTLIQ
jgi:endoglucanase